MKTFWLLLNTALLAAGISCVVWRDLLVPTLPPTPAPTQFQRDFGFNVPPAIAVLLDQPLPANWHYRGDFAGAVDRLRDASGVNIFCNWRAMEAVDVDQKTPVALDAGGKTFGNVVLDLLHQAGGGKPVLGCEVEDSVLIFSRRDDLGGNFSTRVYDIRDLLRPAIPVPERYRQSRQAMLLNVLNQVRVDVEPGTWALGQFSHGTMREISGQLIVTHNRLGQVEMIRWLERTRRPRSLQLLAFRTSTVVLSALLLVGMLRALSLWKQRRAQRLAGHCLRCGYDLRASSGRCSECGVAIQDVAPSLA